MRFSLRILFVLFVNTLFIWAFSFPTEGYAQSGKQPSRAPAAYYVSAPLPAVPGILHYSTSPDSTGILSADSLRAFLAGLDSLVVVERAQPVVQTRFVRAPLVEVDFDTAPRSTLTQAFEEIRTHVLDRRHARGGLYGTEFYDRGAFRHITPFTTHEHTVDMLTYRFPFDQDFGWWNTTNGLRMRVGSIYKEGFAFVTEAKFHVPFLDSNALQTNLVLQQDGQAERAFLEIGYFLGLGENHNIGFRQTATEAKVDLDFSINYEYKHERIGAFQFEVTAQDYLNNMIKVFGVENNRGNGGDIESIERVYVRKPYLLSAFYASPMSRPLRLEWYGSLQPEREAHLKNKFREAPYFSEQERIVFSGGMIEYSFPALSIGGFFQSDFSRLERAGLDAETKTDYVSRQQFLRYGVFLINRGKRISFNVWAFRDAYYDGQAGENFELSLIKAPLDYDETSLGIRASTQIQPWQGRPFARISYIGLVKDLPAEAERYKLVRWTNRLLDQKGNGRITVQIGTPLGDRGFFSWGFGYDLDGDLDRSTLENLNARRFDKGFGQLVLKF